MRKSLTKSRLIRLKSDINKVFKAGNRYSFSCFKLLVADNNLDYSRIIVIPVKHYGNSVQRNLVRRQIKEIFRLNQDRVKDGLDFVVIVYPDKSLNYKEKEQIILNLMERSGSINHV